MPSSPRQRRFVTPRQKRRVAGYMTWGVVLLHGAMLLTLAVTPAHEPLPGKFFEILWAWAHKPTFYPFVALLIFGPPLTILACRIKGLHRWWLLFSWCTFIALMANFFGERVMLMTRMLWWRYME